MRKRVLIFDAGLRNKRGHHFNTDAGIIAEARRRGIAWELFGLKWCDDPDVTNELSPRPLFDIYGYDTVPAGSTDRSGYLSANAAYYSSLKTLGDRYVNENDVLMFHTVHSPNILAVATWLEEIAASKQPLAIITILYPDFAGDSESTGMVRTEIFREALTRLARIASLPIWILADSSRVKTSLEELSGNTLQVQLSPMSTDYDEMFHDGCSGRNEENTSCIIGYFGHSQVRKGALMIPTIIAKVSAARSKVGFSVQMDVPGVDNVKLAKFLRSLKENEKVDLHEGSLTSRRYFMRMRSCDIVMLPYSPAYRWQGSGICLEAAALGKVIVLPSYSSMRDQLGEYGSATVYFSEWNSSCIADAAVVAVDNLKDLKDQAIRAAPSVLKARGPVTFYDAAFGKKPDRAQVD